MRGAFAKGLRTDKLLHKWTPIYQEQRTPKVAESNEGRESLPL